MKKLLPTLISTKRIAAGLTTYDQTKLIELANTMLELGGFLNPPILEKVGDSYKTVKGHLQVAAAHKAREIAPRAAELIPAFVIESSTAKRQIEILKANTGTNNLDRKTIKELKAIARSKGITPVGDKRKRQTWLDALN